MLCSAFVWLLEWGTAPCMSCLTLVRGSLSEIPNAQRLLCKYSTASCISDFPVYVIAHEHCGSSPAEWIGVIPSLHWVTGTKCSLKHAFGLWSRNPSLKCDGSIWEPHSNYCCQSRDLPLVWRCSHCSRTWGKKSWCSWGINSLHFLLVNSCSWLGTIMLGKQNKKKKGITAWTFICSSK